MVHQDPFLVEQFMDKHETGIKHNMGETCVESLTLAELSDIANKDITTELLASKLTYGHIRGSPALKDAIVSLYDNEIDSENIVITNGAIGGNFLVLYSLIGPQDKVIVVDPTYQQLQSVPGVFSGSKDNVIPWTLTYDSGFQPDLDELRRLVEQHTPKLVVINNPNNPTGVVWNNSTLSQIIDICRPHGTYILCDEVYRPLYHSVAEPPSSIVQLGYDKTISTSSTSKAFSLAGLRLGWIVTKDKDLLEDLWIKRDYNTISVSVLDDVVATLALQNYKKILKRSYDICTTNLKIIDEFIAGSGGAFSWVRPVGGSTCFIRVNGDINTEELCIELATKHATLAVPGYVFGEKWVKYIRVGFGNGTEGIKNGLRELKQLVQEKSA